MNSQMNRTREVCLEYHIESTAKLLANIQSQLHLEQDTFESQKPLLNRFIQRLQSHAERLQLGQINTGTDQQIKQAEEAKKPCTDSAPEKVNSQQSTHPSNSIEVTTESSDKVLFQAGSSSASQLDANILESHSNLVIYWCAQDNPSYQSTRKQLDNFGYSIKETTDLMQAHKETHATPNHVLFCDLPSLIENPQLQSEPFDGHFVVFSEQDDIESRLQATRFQSSLFLPAPIDTIQLLKYIDTIDQAKDRSPHRVVVMEDSKAQAKFNDKVLSNNGFETCIVTDPMQLLNSMSNFEPEVILMDMQMPGCSGIELTKVLRQMQRYAHIPIVFLSAEENETKQQEALLSGGDAFIKKPVKKEQLLFMTQLYAGRHRYIQSQMVRDSYTGLNSIALFREQLAIEAERALRQSNPMYFGNRIIAASFDQKTIAKIGNACRNSKGQHILGLRSLPMPTMAKPLG